MELAFYKGTLPGLRGLYSRLVRQVDRGQYSHCEIVLSDGLCGSASWYDGGVRLKKVKLAPERWDIIDIGVDDWPPEQEIRDWFIRREGGKYDLLGSLGVVFRLFGQRNNSWFCSEAVAEALGIREAWRISPNTLAALMAKYK